MPLEDEMDKEWGDEESTTPLHPTKGRMKERKRTFWRWAFLTFIVIFNLGVLLYTLVLPALRPREFWNPHPTSSGPLHISDEGDLDDIDKEIDPGPRLFGSATDIGSLLHSENHIYRPPRTVELEWIITKAERRPDGVLKAVYLINDQFPGPTVEARSGDEVIITVHNHLEHDEKTSIHWHGLQVPNDMDGVAGVTQCAIGPGGSFTYRLTIPQEQHGTLWYHSHFETQRTDGLYGPLVIHKPAENGQSDADRHVYEGDQVLMISDWYHRSATEVLEYYMDWKNFKIEPAPDSMLLSGKGHFNCSMAVPARPLDCTEIEIPHVTLPAARTRLRIVNAGALTGFTISMPGFALKVVTVDGGGEVDKHSISETVGVLYPGERIDVVVERLHTSDEKPGQIVVALDRESLRFPNLALTRTQHFPTRQSGFRNPNRRTSLVRSDHKINQVDLAKLSGPNLMEWSMPDTAQQTILLYSTISYLAINENRPKGFINRTSWALAEDDSSALLAFDRTLWPTDPGLFVPLVEEGQWVDIVLNNADDKGHPFHLHGHDFYLLASHRPSHVGAYDAYNPFDQSKEPAGGPMNLQNPLKKDTVYVPSMGYVVLRFKPTVGLWMFHCHVIWHQSVGMGMAVQVGGEGSPKWKNLMDTAGQSCANNNTGTG